MFSKTDKNYLTDVSLVVIGVVCTLTGLALGFEPEVLIPFLAAVKISSLHKWTGYTFLLLIVFHLIMHTKWINAVTKSIFKQKSKLMATLLTVLLSIGLCTAISILSPNQNISGDSLSNMLDMTPNKKPSQDTYLNEPGTQNTAKAKYTDGTYTGNASGYRPGLVVETTIVNGAITKITIVSHNEKGPNHYGAAMKRIPEEIIKNQATSVDNVSGATKTSKGIKDAVNDALSKAIKQ